MSMGTNDIHRIVIVGGGAGGLELATRLGKLYRRRPVEVTLVERARTHFWKPHLHEIAAGSMDLGRHEIDYLAQSHWNHFRYIAGPMTGLDRQRKVVRLGPVIDSQGEWISDERERDRGRDQREKCASPRSTPRRPSPRARRGMLPAKGRLPEPRSQR